MYTSFLHDSIAPIVPTSLKHVTEFEFYSKLMLNQKLGPMVLKSF